MCSGLENIAHDSFLCFNSFKIKINDKSNTGSLLHSNSKTSIQKKILLHLIFWVLPQHDHCWADCVPSRPLFHVYWVHRTSTHTLLSMYLHDFLNSVINPLSSTHQWAALKTLEAFVSWLAEVTISCFPRPLKHQAPFSFCNSWDTIFERAGAQAHSGMWHNLIMISVSLQRKNWELGWEASKWERIEFF